MLLHCSDARALVRSSDERSPLRQEPINLRRELRLRLRGRVKAAYLFGSHAAGTACGMSDIDLILITDTDRPFVDRPKAFADLYENMPALDLLVYTPQEFECLRSNPQLGFWRSVFSYLEQLV